MNLSTLGLALIILLLASPRLWSRYIFFKHSRKRQDLPGTGLELLQHQLKALELDQVKLVQADNRNHYDPNSSSVCLADSILNSSSLTALVRTAYTLGYALQHRRNLILCRCRQGLLELAEHGELSGSSLLLISPMAGLVNPELGGLLLFCAVTCMLGCALLRLLVIPIEWQAGFGFALPLLNQSAQFDSHDQLAFRQLMVACVLNRSAGALTNLLDSRHWLKALPFSRRLKQEQEL